MASTKTCRRILVATGIVCLLSASASSYDRKAAIDYSDRYWGGGENDPRYNTRFFAVYPNDCANFISQTFMAGNLRFSNASGEFGQNGTMIRANELGPELTANHGAATVVDYDGPDTIPPDLPLGDPLFVMRLFNASRTYWVEAKTHAMLLTEHTPLAFTAHSKNHVRYPVENIDDYFPSTDWDDFLWTVGFNWLRYFHIPTGPVVKYVALSQVQLGQTKLLREYFYDDDYDPDVKLGEYYAHTYNGLNEVTLEDGAAGQGELRMKVIFDATMNEASFVAAFGNAVPFTTHRFTTIGWSTTHQPVDTWEGRIDLDAAVADGLQTISIDGRSADGSPLDSDGNLAVYNPGPATPLIFTIATTPPSLKIFTDFKTLCKINGSSPQDNSQCQYPVTAEHHVSAQATPASAAVTVKNITIYGPSSQSVFRVFQGPSFLAEPFSSGGYWALACDTVQNCTWAPFAVDDSSGTILPDPPKCPPGKKCALLPSWPKPLCTGGSCPAQDPPPGSPPLACFLSSPNPITQLIDSAGGMETCTAPKDKFPITKFLWPDDPNSMHGPEGSVTPGQAMVYRVEFENVGEGTAVGVYIKDVLDPWLDDSVLTLSDMYSLGFSTTGTIISTTPANFPWHYDPATRTMTLLASITKTNDRGGQLL